MNVTVFELALSVASVDDAAGLVEVIHAAFGARPPLDPPSSAISETSASVAATVRAGGGIYATVDSQPAGALLIAPLTTELATFQRVSVHPQFQRHGVASAMVVAAQDYAAELGFTRVELFARQEFADLIAYWQHRGFSEVRAAPHGVILGKALPVSIRVPTSAAMQRLGEQLSELFRPGDLVVASGDLGAGKTTLTQGIGRGLGCTDQVISPTFVLSRVHRSAAGRADLVHVDAYRLSSPAEIDDLDLDAAMARAVTVVEWGEGLVEALAESRLEIDIRTRGSERLVLLRPVGPRWHSTDLAALRDPDAAAPTGPER
ncbi:MAG TPA: tRNA (adenosine(37)-N6)-threonylcarbamoyltransferase complex ATPase subunit type 1 TsaE [Propionibacteriaceae bacterium]|nr:tRNA (adenosine(37)-N6)-threonylcarbamoyltransferase complex ATPase subunit type 1 TsaE [Propionibacteriaceae bacterium]